MDKHRKIRVLDVGATHIKFVATDHKIPVKIKSGPPVGKADAERQSARDALAFLRSTQLRFSH